jgi:hypothetical protein
VDVIGNRDPLMVRLKRPARPAGPAWPLKIDKVGFFALTFRYRDPGS